MHIAKDSVAQQGGDASEWALSAEPPKPPPSVIEALFGGRLASRVVCGGCGNASKQLEPFI